MLAQLAAATSDGIALVRAGRCIYLSDGFVEMLGASQDKLRGRAFLELVEPDSLQVARLSLEPVTGAPAEHEYGLHLGARRVRVRVSSAQLGEVIGLVFTDVTKTKAEQARLLLADRMMSVGALAEGVAHDINNPLSYVLGNLAFFLEELPRLSYPDEATRIDLKEAAEETLEGAERIRDIVRGLQSFARADQDVRRPLDLNRVIESTLAMAFIRVRHRAKLVKELGPLPPIFGNESRVGQAVLNLLLHAANSLPEGRAAENRITIGTRFEAPDVILSVKDTGPGMMPDEAARIFDSLGGRKAGPGLGLPIAHAIITELGGTMRVRSAIGEGAEYQALLPSLAETETTLDLPSAAADIEDSLDAAPRILVIDDEPLIATAFKRALQHYEMEAVESGRAAIDALTDDPSFALIFCDILMPDLTGMDVFQWAKSRMPGVEERFIFMTGGLYNPMVMDFLRSTKNLTLEKPFNPVELRRVVEERVGPPPVV